MQAGWTRKLCVRKTLSLNLELFRWLTRLTGKPLALSGLACFAEITGLTAMVSFSAADLNSAPHVCRASISPAQLSPQPPPSFFKRRKKIIAQDVRACPWLWGWPILTYTLYLIHMACRGLFTLPRFVCWFPSEQLYNPKSQMGWYVKLGTDFSYPGYFKRLCILTTQ